MWLLELQLDCEFEIKWNMFAGVLHVENGTCMLEMVEEKVCVRKNCNWRIVWRERSGSRFLATLSKLYK